MSGYGDAFIGLDTSKAKNAVAIAEVAAKGDVPSHVANGWALLINDYAASPVQARPLSLVAGAERAA
jgi:hypothetical protein